LTVQYPPVNNDQLTVGYHYTALGFLWYLADEAAQQVYWRAIAMNAAGQVTDEVTRNGVETARDHNGATGWLRGSSSTAHADGDKLIQSWSYQYNEMGNLTRRQRNDQVNVAPSDESFTYDALDRLKSAETKITAQSYDVTEAYDYYDNGNIFHKGSKQYAYTGCNGGAHAVCSIDGGSAFVYDERGNMTSGLGRSLSYNAQNKVTHVDSHPLPSQGHDTGVVDFAYGADGSRVLQQASDGTSVARTTYVGLGDTGKSLYERTSLGTPGAPPSSFLHVQFIYAGPVHGGNALAVRSVTVAGSSTSDATKYYHFDHLGSVTAMSDEKGHVVDALWGGGSGQDATIMGYDAWGARRGPEGRPSNPASFDLQPGHREFTGHEAIPNVGLVNMNGRVYDPVLGRFLSPDSSVQFAGDLQSHNRYSYVQNNPLTYADPTGHWINGYFDFAVGVGLTVGSAIVCTGPQAVACAGAFIVAGIAYTASSMIHEGASFDQVAIASLFSLTSSEIGGPVGGAVGGPIVGGAMAGAMTAVMMQPMTGGKLGENLLHDAAMGGLSTAVTMAVEQGVQVTQAERNEDTSNRSVHPMTRQEADARVEAMEEQMANMRKAIEAREEWILAKLSGWNVVVVSGARANPFGHAILNIGGPGGWYFDVHDIYNNPTAHTEAGYQAYLREENKVELQRIPVDVPRPWDASDRLHQLLGQKWLWLMIPHNCMNFCETVIHAGGSKFGSYTNLPTLEGIHP
jgi:RHS repeat-associated protein